MNNLGRSSRKPSNTAQKAAADASGVRVHLRALALTALLLSLSLTTVRAQIVETGTITGVVHDNSGAVIASTQVTIRNAATGLANNTVTDSQGIYVSPPLPPGDYNVTFEAAGLENCRSTYGSK